MAREPTTEDVFFATMVAKAEVLSVLSFVVEICGEIELKDPDGLSVMERFFTQRRVELEKLFRSLENRHPALAASLHEQYEKAKEQLGEENA